MAPAMAQLATFLGDRKCILPEVDASAAAQPCAGSVGSAMKSTLVVESDEEEVEFVGAAIDVEVSSSSVKQGSESASFATVRSLYALDTNGLVDAVPRWSKEHKCMVKVGAGGAEILSTMKRGPAGFWEAEFLDGEVVSTEYPALFECGPRETIVPPKVANALRFFARCVL